MVFSSDGAERRRAALKMSTAVPTVATGSSKDVSILLEAAVGYSSLYHETPFLH